MIIDVVFILEKQQLFCSFVPAKPDIQRTSNQNPSHQLLNATTAVAGEASENSDKANFKFP